MKLGPQAIWKVFIFFKISFIWMALFIFSGCSLSGSIKSVGSQKDEAPASPITSPVTGSDELRLTEPTDYIKPSNQSAYPITGSCKTTGTLTIEVNNTVVKTGVSCTNETFSATLDLTSITSGDVSIKVYSEMNAEIVSTVTIMKDTVAPSLIGTVIDGTYFNSTSTTPTLTWAAAADAHSGVAEYEIAIGTTAGATDILNWTGTNSMSATHSQSGLTLIEGTQYFASLRAVDNAGNVSTTIQSDGWTVDATAPTLATSFTDGEINFSSTSSKVLNWVASTDAASGLSGYEVALGTTAGATDVMNWTSVGNVITDTIDSLTLFGNRRYYASLRSVDVAGNRTASVMSDGWWNLRQTKKAVDVTNPQARWVSTTARFGLTVALSEDGNTMVVGAQFDDSDEQGLNILDDAGAVFIYVKSAGSWVFQQKIVATGLNARNTGDEFGASVGISGDTVVVGAYKHDYDLSSGSLSNAGAAFVYTRSGNIWSLQQKILPSGTNARLESDEFGYTVAISGETIAISAYKQDYDDSGSVLVADAGAAYIFTRTSNVWTQQQKLVAAGTNARVASDAFGKSISISGDTVAVGAWLQSYDAIGENPASSAGAVYVFFRTSGTWAQQQKLVSSGTNARLAGDTFGQSVSLDQDTLVVGAGNHDYNASGADYRISAGAAFVFTRTAGVWSQQQKIVASGTNNRMGSTSGDTYGFNGDHFGSTVKVIGDLLVVGAQWQDYDASGNNFLSLSGAAFVFTRSAGTWTQQQKIVPTGTNARNEVGMFGWSVTTDGAQILIGGSHNFDSSGLNSVSGAGAVYAFSKPATTWTQDQKIVDESQAQSRAELVNASLGESIAISEDGNTLVVGSYKDDTDANNENYLSDSGAAYVYVKSAGIWIFQQKLVGTGVNSRIWGDYFGYSVAISGETIVVGAINQDADATGGAGLSNAGAAYVYTRTSGVWTQQQKIVASGTNGYQSGDNFGHSVAIDNETIVVGAINQDYDAIGGGNLSNAGAAYVFTRSAGVWTQQQKLVATGTNGRGATNYFGYSVDVDGDTLVSTSRTHGYDENGSNNLFGAGAAFVYTRSAGVWSLQQKIVATGVNSRSGNYFGHAVSLSDDNLIVGAISDGYDSNGDNFITSAGAVYIFVRAAGIWSQQQKLVAGGVNARNANDQFGWSVSYSGESIVVGARRHDYDSDGESLVEDAGAVYLFRRTGTTWAQELKVTPTVANSRALSSYFGSAVALSENLTSDGYTIGVGAPGDNRDSTGGGNAVTGAGSVYIFD